MWISLIVLTINFVHTGEEGLPYKKEGGACYTFFKRTLEIITRLYFASIVLYYSCLKFWSLLRSTNSPFSAQYHEKLLVAFVPDRATGNDDDDDIKRYKHQRSHCGPFEAACPKRYQMFYINPKKVWQAPCPVYTGVLLTPCGLYRVCIPFQKQISRTFLGLRLIFQGF